MTHNNQIICYYTIFIQAGTYQEYIDTWFKRRLFLRIVQSHLLVDPVNN